MITFELRVDEVSYLLSMELTSKVSVFGKNKFGQLILFGLFAKLRCQDTTSNYDCHV